MKILIFYLIFVTLCSSFEINKVMDIFKTYDTDQNGQI